MVIHPLSVMMFAPRDDITHITAFYSIVSVVSHKLVGCIQMSLIITNGSRCFMMHHQFHTFLFGIRIQHLHIKIRIGSDKIKYIIFGFAKPVFPAFVPAFYQYSIESVGCGKVDITFHVSGVGRMFAVRFCFGVICFT